MSVQWFSTGSISELLEGDFQHKLSFHTYSYFKKCVGAGRGSGNMHFVQAPQGILIYSYLGTARRKVLLPHNFFMLGVVALPGLCALMDVFVRVSLSVCHWGPA